MSKSTEIWDSLGMEIGVDYDLARIDSGGLTEELVNGDALNAADLELVLAGLSSRIDAKKAGLESLEYGEGASDNG